MDPPLRNEVDAAPPTLEETDGSPPALDEDDATTLVRTIRSHVGDEVRSVTYFTPDAAAQLYVRDDLTAADEIAGFAPVERLGFREKRDYGSGELGDPEFTIRVFEHGYLTRVIEGDHGVFVTTDPLTRDRFEELADALSTKLEALPDH